MSESGTSGMQPTQDTPELVGIQNYPTPKRRASLLSRSSEDDLTKINTYPAPLPSVGQSTIFPGLVGGGPFPIFENSSHSVDPHGLNRFLLHPGDGMWDYMQMEPLLRQGEGSSEGASTNGTVGVPKEMGGMDKPSRPSSGTRSGSTNARSSRMARTKSPLSMPPISPEQPDEQDQEEKSSIMVLPEAAVSAMNETSGPPSKFGRATLRLRKSASSFAVLKSRAPKALAVVPASVPAVSALAPPQLQTRSRIASPAPVRNKSASSLLSITSSTEDSMSFPPVLRRPRPTSQELISNSRSPSAHSLAGSCTSTISSEERDGVVTPRESDGGFDGEIRIEGLGDDLVTPEAILPDLTLSKKQDRKQDTYTSRAQNNKTPTPVVTGSNWKSWFGGKKPSKEAGRLAIATRGIEEQASKAANRLSADVLSGVLPGSVVASDTGDATSGSMGESLDLRTKFSQPVPDTVRNLRTSSISKLSALRAPSPHPIITSTQLPSYLSLDGMRSKSTSAVAALKFPRSQNACVLPGMGLGPAEAGMRIDVVVRGLIKRIDDGSFDTSEVKQCTSRLSMEEKMETRYKHKRQRQRSAEAKGSGILMFANRPTFEGRCDEYGSDGEARAVETAGNRALYDIDLSVGLQALADEIRSGRVSAVPATRPRPLTLPAVSQRHNAFARASTRDTEEEEDDYGQAEDNAVTPTQARSSRQIPSTLPRSSSASSLPTVEEITTLERKTSKRRPSMPNVEVVERARPMRQSQIPLRPISKVISWSSESDDTDDEEDSCSGDEGLMYKSKMSTMKGTSVLGDSSASLKPGGSAAMVNPGKDCTKQPSHSAEHYRAEIARARERREHSRSGQKERLSMTQTLAQAHGTSKLVARQRTPSTESAPHARPSMSTRSHTVVPSASQPDVARQDYMRRATSSSGTRQGHQNRRSMSQLDMGNAFRRSTAMSPGLIYPGYPQAQMMYVPIMVPYQQYPSSPSGMQHFPASYSMPAMHPQAVMDPRSRPMSMSFGSGGRGDAHGRSAARGGPAAGRRSPVQ